MFGYITVNQPELKFREYDWYHSFYCGLCRQLQETYGFRGQMTLTYDMTFLILLLTGLYEPETRLEERRCHIHPLRKHLSRANEFTEYAADMNLLLAYYQCLDDWKDDRNIRKKLMSAALSGGCVKVRNKYPEKAALVEECLNRIGECEKENSEDVDRASGEFGRLTAEIFACRRDEWERELRNMGFFLGKFIYLMDAFEDLEKDEKSGSYNPFLLQLKKGKTKAYCEEILNMMMAECCRSFERLPILEGAEVLRNILYSGVWARYGIAESRRKAREEKNG